MCDHCHTVITSASCLANGVEYLCPPSSVELHLAPETLHERPLRLLALRESCLAVRDKALLIVVNRETDVIVCTIYISTQHEYEHRNSISKVKTSLRIAQTSCFSATHSRLTTLPRLNRDDQHKKLCPRDGQIRQKMRPRMRARKLRKKRRSD